MRTELVLTPKSIFDPAAKGVAWALEEKGIAGLFAVLTSEQCATKSQLEKLLAGDSLINKLRLGELVFRARKNGKVNEKEFRKYFSASLYWKLMENWVDDKVALKLFEEFAMGDVQSAEKSVYKLARMYSGVAVRTYRDFVKKAEEVAVNLRGDDGLYSADMEEYVHQRAVYLHIQEVKEFQLNKRIEKATDAAEKRGKKLTALDLAKIEDDFKKSFIESNITQQRLKQMRDKLSKTEQQRADRAHQELLKFYRGILDELLESGVVSEDSYKTITTAYPNYVPLYRDMSDRKAADIDSGKLVQDLRKGAFEKALYPLDYFHGSQRPVINMIDNMMHYHSKARQSMELNRVITALDYLVDEFKGTDHEGKFIKVHSDTSILKDAVYYDENGNVISENEFDKYFENPDALTETEIDGSGVGRMVVSKSRDNTPYMVARKNGETVLYEVHPAIIEALRTMQKSDPRNKEDAWIRNVAVKTGDWLRTGATASPDFWVKNMFRDTTYAYTVSDTEMNFVSDLMKSSVYVVARKFFKDDAEFNGWWDDYMAQGGGMGTRLNDIAARRMAFRNEVLGMGSPYGRKNIFSSRGARFIDSCTTVPLQRLQAAASTAETASRFAEFVAAKKAGLSDEEAAFRAMDQQDYGMSGSRVRFLNKVIPFFNAPIQSKYKIFRAFKKHPGAVVARSLRAITVPTIFAIGMQAFFADDDQKRQILEAHDSIRTNFWLIPVPGGHGIVRIAKPFDMSVLFANTLESIYEYAWQIDPISAETALKEFLYRNTKYSLLSWSLMPQVMSIATEAIWGKNWFYGTDVVPLVEQDLSPDLQFDANSYHLTIFMAKMVNDLGLSNVPGFGVLASPRRSESLINTTFASLGTLTLDMIDLAWDTTAFLTGKETYREEVKGERPRSDSRFAKTLGRDVTNVPLLKSFLLNNDYGASVSEFYDEYNKLEAMQKSYNAEMAAGRPEAALKKFPEKDYRKYVIYKDAFDAMNTMKPGNKLYRMVRDSRHLTGEEKGRMLKQISADRNRYARELMLWSKMYDAGIEDMLEKTYDYEAEQRAPFASSESYDERAGNVENMGEDLRVKLKEKITQIEAWTEEMNAKGKNGAAK